MQTRTACHKTNIEKIFRLLWHLGFQWPTGYFERSVQLYEVE